MLCRGGGRGVSAGVHEVPQENLEGDFTLLGFAVFFLGSLIKMACVSEKGATGTE